MGIGVDRVDYTKGILERFLAIERFLENIPAIRGNSPSCRSERPAAPTSSVITICSPKWKPRRSASIGAFKAASGSPLSFSSASTAIQEIEPYYRAADLCLVTSLHDGMNLVAKEFLAARRMSGEC
jgi:trehalose-6-phosphate synthase